MEGLQTFSVGHWVAVLIVLLVGFFFTPAGVALIIGLRATRRRREHDR